MLYYWEVALIIRDRILVMRQKGKYAMERTVPVDHRRIDLYLHYLLLAALLGNIRTRRKSNARFFFKQNPRTPDIFRSVYTLTFLAGSHFDGKKSFLKSAANLAVMVMVM